MHVSKALLVAAGLLGSTVLAAPGAPDHRAQDTVERDAQAEPPAENPVLPSVLAPLLAPIPSFLSSLLSPVSTRVSIPVVATTIRVPTPATTTRASSLVTVSAAGPTQVAYTTLFSPFPAFPAVVSVLQSIFATNPAIATATAVVVPISIIPSAFASTRIPTGFPTPSILPSVSLHTVSLPSLALPSLALPSPSLPSSLLRSIATPSISLPSFSLPSISLPSISLPSIGLPSSLLTSIPPITFTGPSLTTLLSALPPTYTGSLTSAISVAAPEDCPVSYVTITQVNTQTLYVGHPLAPNATLSAPFVIPLLNVTNLPVNLTLPLFTGKITGGPFPTLNLSSLPGLPVTLRPLPNLTLPTVFPSLNITALLPTGRPNLTATLPLPLLNLTTRSRSSIQFSTLPLPTFSLPTFSLPTLSLPPFSLPEISLPTPSIPTLSTSLVIATTVTPISTAVFSTSFALPSGTLPLIGTVGPAAPTGRPSTQNIHCGIHGAPIGDYYLATYAWNKRDVPVTLEGCYQFCNNVWGFTEGCQSFNFYLEPGLGAPRCDLYAGTVAYEVASIAAYSPYTWFDLGCGEPSQWIAGNPGGPRQ